MRLTVGPLPPSVYWRRRAVVVGALLAAIALVVAVGSSIGGGGNRAGRPAPTKGASGPGNSPTGASPTPTVIGGESTSPGQGAVGPGGEGGSPGGGAPTGAEPGPTVTSSTTQGPVNAVGEKSAAPCSDTEISVTAAASPSPGVYGGTMELSLTIASVTDHECSRDIGSATQELRVLQGTAVVWSSDDCGAPQQPDIRTFGPGASVRFIVRWNTYRTAPDDCRIAATPAQPGTYSLVARVGTKVGDPVAFSIAK